MTKRYGKKKTRSSLRAKRRLKRMATQRVNRRRMTKWTVKRMVRTRTAKRLRMLT